MPRRSSPALLVLLAACSANLPVPEQALISCSTQSDCAEGLVCVPELRRCLQPGAACIEQRGDTYAPAPDGNACTRDGRAGVCGGGSCVVCGDGVRGGPEECDDGNTVDTDACLTSCRAATCGDGLTHAGVEACDDGDDDYDDACLPTCVANVCGDGHVNAGVEPCDDTNDDPNDGCLACQLTPWTSEIVINGGGARPPDALGFGLPAAVAVDGGGNVFFTDGSESVLYRLDAVTGMASIVAGNARNGTFGQTPFYPGMAPTQLGMRALYGVTVTPGGTVFFAESYSARAQIYRLGRDGSFEVFAGNGGACSSSYKIDDPTCGEGGLATLSPLRGPGPLLWDDAAQTLYFGDGRTIRRVSAAFGLLETIAGNERDCNSSNPCDDADCVFDTWGQVTGGCGDGGSALDAIIMSVDGLALDEAGNVYYSDTRLHRVRRIDAITGVITTVFGNGQLCSEALPSPCGDGGHPLSAKVYSPNGLAFDASGALYVSDREAGGRIRRLTPSFDRVDTYAGKQANCFVPGACQSLDGPRLDTELYRVRDIEMDPSGRLIVLDELAHVVRRVEGDQIITIAGNRRANTPPTGLSPSSMARGLGLASADSAGNVYFTYDNMIFRAPASGAPIEHLAGDGRVCASGACGTDGPATSAQLAYIGDLTVTDDGWIFVSESSRSQVRRISPAGVISVAAGSGTWCASTTACADGADARAAQLRSPGGIDVGADCTLFIADGGTNTVRKVASACAAVPGPISRVAGNGNWGFSGDNGAATSAALACPQDVSVDASGNFAIADIDNCRVRRVTGTTITSLISSATACGAPSGGPDTPQGGCGEWLQVYNATNPAPALPYIGPMRLHYASNGDLYVDDWAHASYVRRTSGGALDVFLARSTAGVSDNIDRDRGDQGPYTQASFNSINDFMASPPGHVYFVTATPSGSRVRRVDATSGVISTVVGPVDRGASGLFARATLANPVDAAWLGDDLVVAAGNSGQVRAVDFAAGQVSVIAGYYQASPAAFGLARYSPLFEGAAALAVEASTSRVFVADQRAHQLRVIDASAEPWSMARFAGTGAMGFSTGAPANSAMSHPGGLAVDEQRRLLYVADTGNHVIRTVALGAASPTLATLAGAPLQPGSSGDGGNAGAARLNLPGRLAVAPQDGSLYLDDAGNRRLRRIDPTGVITTVLDYAETLTPRGGAEPFEARTIGGLAFDAFGNLWVASGPRVFVLGGEGDTPPVSGASLAVVYGADRSRPPESITACVQGLVRGATDAEMLLTDACTGMLVRLTRD